MIVGERQVTSITRWERSNFPQMKHRIMKKYLPLFALVLFNLIIGWIVLPDFGQSIDEPYQHGYADRTIQGVRSVIETGEFSDFFFKERPKQGSHGPAFMMVVISLRNAIIPNANQPEQLRFCHYIYFMAFQAGIVAIYFLARHWMSDMGAFGTALLFNAQPLLMGHSLMNPKDVVFMSLMIVSAALGLWMVDRGDKKTILNHGTPSKSGIGSFFRSFLSMDVWLAAFALGFASATRLVGPLIGIVALVYIVASRKWTAWPRFVAYGLISFGFMILLWPYLWPDPFGRLLASIGHCVTYPGTHLTLFRGTLYDANEIPHSYLPVLLAIQLTEPALILIVVGMIALLKKHRPDLVGLTLIWFGLPATMIILICVNLYNNYRQVFFLLPPLFLLAGFGLDWIFSYLRRTTVRMVMLCIIILPGLFASMVLHPYEYVYYNQLVGGVTGAYRNFELDYWGLALMEAQTYVNQVAEPDAHIFVGDSKATARTFARADLLFNTFGNQRKDWGKYDYLVISTSKNFDQRYSDFPVVFQVERAGVPLILVMKPDMVQEDLRP